MLKVKTTMALSMLGGVMLAVSTGAADHANGLQAAAADEVLQRVRSVYAELRSYADTGTVTLEYGTSSTDRHRFATSFIRAPRHFVLDFNKSTGDRYVVWGNPGAFHTWWKTTNQRFDYPNPNNVPAISQSGANTSGTVLKVPTLLYANASLGGHFTNFTTSDAGIETIDGRRCHRISGKASDTYAASGREVNVRQMTLWIDAEYLLIRKVVEEWAALPGQRNRAITSYEPQANPTLDAARLAFTPPR